MAQADVVKGHGCKRVDYPPPPAATHQILAVAYAGQSRFQHHFHSECLIIRTLIGSKTGVNLQKMERRRWRVICTVQAPYLLARTPITIFDVRREDRSFFGSSDFVISAVFKADTGQDERAAYIWEVKAPQCNLMMPDDNANRFRPTTDLVKAENQLIHYVEEATFNGSFRDRFRIGSTDKIYAAGIIIGTDERLVSSSEQSRIELARTSLSIRKKHLYRSENIRVLTWDRILDYLAETEQIRL